jgi:hypothetical protein
MFEGRRAMLIDGVILEEGPMNPPHAITLELVEQTLRGVFGAGWRIRSQSPLVLGQDIDPEPDFAIIAGSVRGSVGHPTTANLVIEVADTGRGLTSSAARPHDDGGGTGLANLADRLRAKGWKFYNFIGSGACRFMCSWAVTDADVDALFEEKGQNLMIGGAERLQDRDVALALADGDKDGG